MSTMDTSSNIQTPKDTCGLCSKLIRKDEFISTEAYISKCMLCQEPYRLHANTKGCALTLWKNSKLYSKWKDLPACNIFNDQETLNLLCYQCKVTCFICKGKKNHAYCKLYIHVLKIICMILLITDNCFSIYIIKKLQIRHKKYVNNAIRNGVLCYNIVLK